MVAAVGLAAGIGTASAEPIPGMLGHDHTGVTVPNIKEAIAFFTDIVGCKEAMSFGPFSDDKGTFMADLLNVHPRAKIQQITMMRCGNGSNIELFQYESPDQQNAIPKNSDIGGHHIAFYVEDINVAAKYLKDKGVRTMMGPLPVDQGPAAGQSILYFMTPWGLQLELISYPNGMAYEKDGGTILWSPKDPGK
ncbi:MAG: VOC family protein [Hyphomicrobiales bacterium]